MFLNSLSLSLRWFIRLETHPIKFQPWKEKKKEGSYFSSADNIKKEEDNGSSQGDYKPVKNMGVSELEPCFNKIIIMIK